MNGFISDLLQGFRVIRRAPVISGAAILALAIGIGANATIFSWVNALVLRPLSGVDRQDEIVVVDEVSKSGLDQRLSYPNYVDYRDNNTVFRGILVHAWQPLNLASADRADRSWAELVSGNFFDVLGVRTAIGRTFSPDEGIRPGADPVAVIGHAFWMRRFNGNPSAVGQTIKLNGIDFTVIGVAPSAFRGATPSLTFDLWVPVTMQQVLTRGPSRLDAREAHWLGSMARLRPGVTLEQARDQLSALATRLGEQHPSTNEGTTVTVTTLSDSPWGATNILRPVLGVLTGVVGLVLLIACANVAGLLLSRASGRRRELAVRISLGASRSRLVRQLLAEGLALSMIAGVVGTLAALWCAPLLPALIPPSTFPIAMDFALDGTWLTYAAGVSLLTALLFGLAPAVQATRIDVASPLKEESATSTGGRRTGLRQALVVGQVAGAFVLLVATGLFLRGMASARAIQPGFDPEGLVLASVDLGAAGYTPARGTVFYGEAAAKLQTIPGVESVALAKRVPLNFGGRASLIADVDGYAPQKSEEVRFDFNTVSPAYFETMRIPVMDGREFLWEDRDGTQDVAVVNETAAGRYWAGRNAIGGRIRAEGRWRTIVGVVRDIKYGNLQEQPLPYLYLPLSQNFAADVVVHVRSRSDVASTVAGMREQLQSVDPVLALFDIRPMTEHMSIAFFLYRLGATLLTLFGSIALILTSVGLYAIIAHSTSQRIREVGLRIALGATYRDIVWLVTRQGLKLVTFGLGIGFALAIPVSRLLASVLTEASALDFVTLTATILLLATVTLAASWIPAHRAGRTDPIASLKSR